MIRDRVLSIKYSSQYPVWSMLAIMLLIVVSPFVTRLLCYVAFAICIYRVIRYDARVFAVDYCVLVPFSLLFRTTGGMSLQVYLCLIAAIWYLVRYGIRGDRAYVFLLLLVNYLILRLQMSITNFVLCMGQTLLVCVLLPQQNEESAERTAKAFCWSLLLSSVYALLLRNTWQIQSIRGPEVPAFAGSFVKRFQGISQDPNYYMAMLITGIGLAFKLLDSRRIKKLPFWILALSLTVFGVLTYSKTFFLLLILLVCMYVLWQFRNKKFLWGMALVAAIAVAGSYLLFSENSPFAVVLARFSGATGISELTTGRTDVLQEYMNEILHDPGSMLFGKGLAAERLSKDPHNLYLEITYYTGVTGLFMFISYYIAMLQVTKKRIQGQIKEGWYSRYMVLMITAILFCTLHGMFSIIVYAVFYLAFLPMMLPTKKEEGE